MNDDTVVKVEGLSKKFTRTLWDSMTYGTWDLFRSAIGFPTNTTKLRKNEFWALEDINFEIKKGETFGILGRNGSGKTTLLRIINGIFPPDKGEVSIRGRMGALIAVGAGFHPHMTGRENIYLNGAILGMTNKEINQKLDKIIEFADIAGFIDAPIATYSSGMRVRLGFSIAIHADVEILLVDEILSVGDVNFRKKSFERILEMRRRGVSTLFVSHSLNQLQRLCKRGLLLDKGKQVYVGPMRECIARYVEILNAENLEKATLSKSGMLQENVGLGNVVITNAKAYQTGNDPEDNKVITGKDLTIEFDYEFKEKRTEEFQIRIGMRTAEGAVVQKLVAQEAPFQDETTYANDRFIKLKEKGHVTFSVKNVQLFPQVYVLDLAVMSTNMNIHEGGVSNATEFEVIDPPEAQYHHDFSSSEITNFSYDVRVE